ncbi:uncharacterized protein LOC127378410 [Dicentrarchus labrax]|uniref:uncharacterized protein LOC127378410 n=1 Tax=Dicentrarchus labrax TaxID=13489 RepID=UPI0021F64920|nr:uncharacterized protein LOC127378410 [Dicentrarchus labrax]
MDQWKPWLVLLLPLCLCFDTEVTLVKTIGKEQDVTPICTTRVLRILSVVCKIRTERTRGKGCRLLYQQEWGFETECNSRFTLTMENQTVFLNLTSLTPVDSGNFTCECSRAEGIHILRLNITVEASHEVQNSSSSSGTWSIIVIVIAIFIIVPGVFHRRILRETRCRDDTRFGASGQSVCETPGSLDTDDPENPYASLEQPGSDIYQNISSVHHQHHSKLKSSRKKTATSFDQEIENETDQNYEIYENL